MSFTEVIRFLANAVSHKPHKTNNYKLKSQRSWAGTTSPYKKLRSADLVPFQGPGIVVYTLCSVVGTNLTNQNTN
jgi:hypothetical protein